MECLSRFVEEGSVESQRYYLARKTMVEMLRDRDYVVSDSDFSSSLSEFRSIFTNKPDLERLRFSAYLCSNPHKKILVLFCGTDEIKKQVIIGILRQVVNKESLHRLILIFQSKINFHAQKVVDDFSVKVETFHITELLMNITKHVLAPKHEVLTAEEKLKLLKKYGVKDTQIPRMLETDPIARYYGLEKGQVLKVSYKGAAQADSLVTYRCVV